MNKPYQKFLFFITFFAFAKTLSSQDYLVDFTYLGSRSKLELQIMYFQPVDYGVDLYKIRYKTPDVHLAPDTASGLLILPQVPPTDSLPMLVWGHGTTSAPEDVPSRLAGGYEAAMAYAAFGFAVMAPDYLGLGDSRGFHPYLHAASEASASLDMLWAGFEYLDHHDPEASLRHVFLAGYSQGGHASMALQKEIDDFWSIFIPITATTHMSGPYSISGVMRDRILSDESYGFPAYIAYIFLGYNEAYSLYADIGEVFKEPYATNIEAFYHGGITLTTLNAQLIADLSAGGDTIPKEMLQDSILDGLANNPDHPINEALRSNDTYNFAPQSPTRLYYCGADEQVPPRNSIIADSVMNALGATDVQALDLNPTFDHGPCVFPAVINSIDFFLSFLNPSSIDDLTAGADELTIYPNPTFDEVMIDWDQAINGFTYQIINTNGIIIDQGQSISNKLSVRDIPGGLYMVICSTGTETRMARMLRQ